MLAALFGLGLTGCGAPGATEKALVAGAWTTAAAAIAVADEVAAERAARAGHFEAVDTCWASGCYEDQETPLADAREFALGYVNRLRADHGAGPLVLDYALGAFAQAGSRQLARDGRPHQHIVDEGWACPNCAENQGDPAGVPAQPVRDQLGSVLEGMMTDPPSAQTLLSPEWHRLGAGIVNSGGLLRVTLDFAP